MVYWVVITTRRSRVLKYRLYPLDEKRVDEFVDRNPSIVVFKADLVMDYIEE